MASCHFFPYDLFSIRLQSLIKDIQYFTPFINIFNYMRSPKTDCTVVAGFAASSTGMAHYLSGDLISKFYLRIEGKKSKLSFY
jgi:hypothetical protein